MALVACWPVSGERWSRSGCQVLTVDSLPDLAHRRQTQCEDHAAALDSPGHARLLETLREHRFAAGFGDAAADRQTEAAILLVIHVRLVVVEILVRFR